MVRFVPSFHAKALQTRLRSAALCHCALAVAAVLLLAGSVVTPAAAQMSERQIMQKLGPMMQSEDFNEQLEEFAEENDLDPNMLRALVAKRGKGGKKMLNQMQPQQMQQQQMPQQQMQQQQQPEWMQR
jgi:lipoprotein-anchoring transpeptidase ErfK/SrfK